VRKEVLLAIALGLLCYLCIAVLVIRQAEKVAAHAIQSVSCTPIEQDRE
jgi:hypothetical protein